MFGNRSKPSALGTSRRLILSSDSEEPLLKAYERYAEDIAVLTKAYDNRVIVVTSASPGEGKSTNCLNLAIAMAGKGESVLVIDADMRRPVVHSLMKTDGRRGLSSLLSGDISELSDVTVKSLVNGLEIIPAGCIPKNPSELIAGERMKQLLGIVGRKYDYVFIDTPPVLPVSDALLLNRDTAGIILIVKEKYTTKKKLVKALEMIKMTNGRVLGFIKNRPYSEK